MRDHQVLPAILAFLDDIGLWAEIGSVPEDAFLPGLLIRDGGLVIDPEACLCAGDVLHEAGHLAILPSRLRPSVGGNVEACLERLRATHPADPTDPAWACVGIGGDTPAIAWSFAAALAVGLPTPAIFIQEGYQAQAGANPMALHDQLVMGVFPGILHLARAGLTDSPLAAPGPMTFPRMRRWTAA